MKLIGGTARPILVALGSVIAFLAIAIATAPRITERHRMTILSLEELSASVDLFVLDTGRLPTEVEGLSALVEKPMRDAVHWAGPYLRRPSVPTDQWGTPYIYRITDKRRQGFVIYSAGPNRADDLGAQDDVTSLVGKDTCDVFCDRHPIQDYVCLISLAFAFVAFVGFLYFVAILLVRRFSKRSH